MNIKQNKFMYIFCLCKIKLNLDIFLPQKTASTLSERPRGPVTGPAWTWDYWRSPCVW